MGSRVHSRVPSVYSLPFEPKLKLITLWSSEELCPAQSFFMYGYNFWHKGGTENWNQ